MFSVTLRKSDFNPRVPYYSSYILEPYSVSYAKRIPLTSLVTENRLGLFTYKSLDKEGTSNVGYQYIPGFRRSIYSEAYYWGNPGNYLYYIFSTNDAGFSRTGDIGEEKFVTLEDTGFYAGCDSEFLPRPGSLEGVQIRSGFNDFRNSNPNTYSITERGAGFICEHREDFAADQTFIFGPDLDKVRLYDQVNH